MSELTSGLNFRQLEIFCAVVEDGSTTRSAMKLGLSQPAVSRNVAQLEKDLGFSLFDRAGGRLLPTDAALRLHAEAKKAFTGIEEVVSSARNKDVATKGTICIAAVPSMSLSFLPKVIREFHDQYPDVIISVETRTSRTAMEMTADRRADVALVSMPAASHPGLRMDLVSTPKGVCMMPKDHPLAGKEMIEISDLKGENLIPLSRSHASRHRLEELFANEGITPRIILETSTIEMACVLVEEGLGLTIVNEITSGVHKRHDVAIRAFKPEMNYAYAFAFPVGQPLSEITQIFVTHIRNYLAAHLPSSIPAGSSGQ